MRFLADMGVSTRVIDWLRGRGDDVVHLREQGLQRFIPNSQAAVREIDDFMTVPRSRPG
jgi:predicted nuclease of predicted toxin-antitoxin system